jgi:hypothetical protein
MLAFLLTINNAMFKEMNSGKNKYAYVEFYLKG